MKGHNTTYLPTHSASHSAPSSSVSTAAQGQSPARNAFNLKLVLLFLVWYICGSAANIYCKLFLQVVPDSLFLTVCQYAVGVILVTILCTVLSGLGSIQEFILRTLSVSARRSFDWLWVVVVANAVGHWMTNASMGRVNVSLTHTVKAGEPFFAVFWAYVILQRTSSAGMVASLVPIAIGVAIACSSDISFTLIGFLFAMSSNVVFSLRNIAFKKASKTAHVVAFYGYMCLCGFLILAPVYVAMHILAPLFSSSNSFSSPLRDKSPSSSYAGRELVEQDDHREGAHPLLFSREVGINLALASVTHAAYNCVSFLILRELSPVGHAIGNAMRRIFIISSAIIFFGSPISINNLLGTLLACCGCFLYGLAAQRHQSVPELPTSTKDKSIAV